MSEKQKREQFNKNAPHDQEVNTPASHETQSNEPQSQEVEKKDRDLEILNQVAAERAKSIAAAIIKKNNIDYFPSEQSRYEKKLQEDLEGILKKAYETGDAESVDQELDQLIERVVRNKETEQKNQKIIADNVKVRKYIKDRESEIKTLEDKKSEGEELTAEEQQQLAKSSAILESAKKQYDSVTERCEERWKGLDEEERQSINQEIEKSIKDVNNNDDLSHEEKNAALAELQLATTETWGVEVASRLHSDARTRLRNEKLPSTDDLESLEDAEENDPVRMKGIKGFMQKVKNSYWMSGGSPAKFYSEIMRKDGESYEDTENRRRKVAIGLGATAVGLLTAGAALRLGQNIDFGGVGEFVGDLNPFDGNQESIDSTPDFDPEVDPDLDGDIGDIGDGGEGGETLADGEYVPEDPEKPWDGHNYFDHGYDLENSPFSSEFKLGEFNYGPPIEINEGFEEALLENADSEPAIHASYIQAFNLEGSDLDASEIRERLTNDRDYFDSTLDQIREYMENSDKTQRTLESGTYGSTYGFEMDGEMVLAWDDSIGEPADVMEYRYTDADGVERVTVIKANCGGQVIVEHQPFATSPVGGGSPTFESAMHYPEQANNPEAVVAGVHESTETVGYKPIGTGPGPSPEGVPPVEYEPEPGPEPDIPPHHPEVPPEGPEKPPVNPELPPEEPELPPEQPELPPEEPELPPVELENKSQDPNDWMVPSEIPLAEVDLPAGPPEQIESGLDVFEQDLSNVDIVSPEATQGEEVAVREEVIESGASQEVIADLDLNTDHDAAVEQAIDSILAPTPEDRGQETPLY